MSETPNSNALPDAPHRWRRAAPLLIAALVLALALSATSSALAATPTAPPPVSILTPYSHPGQSTSSSPPSAAPPPTPTAPRSSTRKATSSGSSPFPPGRRPPTSARQTYRGQPVLTWWQGTGLGGLAKGTDYIYNDHYQQIADRQRRQRAQRRRPRVPDHAAEHRADPRLHNGDGRPQLDRRPVEPDGDRRRRAGDRHPDRQSPVPVEQRRPCALQRRASSRCRPARARHGTGSTSTRSPRHRRQPADRRTQHVDGVQGRPPQRRDRSGSSAARPAGSPCRRRPVRR